MTAQVFTPHFPRREKEEHVEGNFISRGITVTEGTQTPSGLKSPVGSPDAGNIHRNTVGQHVPVDLNHPPHSSAHRPAQPATQQFDLHDLTVSQQAMLSSKGKAKHRKSTRKSS